jgi:hypothetical protein
VSSRLEVFRQRSLQYLSLYIGESSIVLRNREITKGNFCKLHCRFWRWRSSESVVYFWYKQFKSTQPLEYEKPCGKPTTSRNVENVAYVRTIVISDQCETIEQKANKSATSCIAILSKDYLSMLCIYVCVRLCVRAKFMLHIVTNEKMGNRKTIAAGSFEW